MPANEREYQRLPGVGLRKTGFALVVATRSRLWLGRDHVLVVDSTGFAEDYKRFYFRDIQAITLRKTGRGQVWNAIFAVLTLLLGLMALPSGTVGQIVFGGLAALMAIVLAANAARGPTAICQLRTAVQTEELPSLGRVRCAQKVLARLRPLIVAAQGELQPEQLQAVEAPPLVLS